MTNKDNITKKDDRLRVARSKVSWVVFVSTLVVVLISLVTVLFPSLIIRSTSSFKDIVINPYEIGVWTYPLLASNFILLIIGILYFKNSLPAILTKSIRFIFDFEVSRKTALITLLVILGGYIILNASEISTEERWVDYKGVKDGVQKWSVSDIRGFDIHVKYFLLSASLNLFGNIRLIPFIGSIALLVACYYITKDIARKRFAGLVATVVLFQSNVFLSYDTSATYDNFWILFYVISLYTVQKRRWYFSPISYILSIFSKTLTAGFIPMTFYWIYRADIAKKKKIRLAISYGVILLVAIVSVYFFNINLIFGNVEFSGNDFWRGFTTWAFQLRFDLLVLLFILPLVVGLFICSRRGIRHAESVMVLIMGILLSAPFLQGFTDLTNQPYRFVPLVVFFAMGVGTILTKRASEKA